MNFKKIIYSKLNSRQKENYNYQKISSVLADYGFQTIKLSDDWKGADFLAQHTDGKTSLKIQLKSRLTLDKKYLNKGIHICFRQGSYMYLYDHDELIKVFNGKGGDQSKSWREKGIYNWPKIPQSYNKHLSKFLIK